MCVFGSSYVKDGSLKTAQGGKNVLLHEDAFFGRCTNHCEINDSVANDRCVYVSLTSSSAVFLRPFNESDSILVSH